MVVTRNFFLGMHLVHARRMKNGHIIHLSLVLVVVVVVEIMAPVKQPPGNMQDIIRPTPWSPGDGASAMWSPPAATSQNP